MRLLAGGRLRAGRVLEGWLRAAKRRLGYYDLRTRLRRPAFAQAVRPTDTFLVGHPKSGNTWLAYMLAVLLDGKGTENVTLANVGRFVPFVHGHDHRIGRYARLPDPRVFRNEYPRYWELYPRIVYLVRDPRAIIPSFWHMYRTMLDDQVLTLESFLTQYLEQSGIFRYWNSDLVRWDHQVVAAAHAAAADSRVIVIRYEDLVADRRAVLERVARFIGLDAGEAAMARAVERGSFDAMRRLEGRFGAEAYLGRARAPGQFVRAGRIDGWRDELPPGQVARIQEVFGPAMRLAGYGAE